jgi:hypothetical protein
MCHKEPVEGRAPGPYCTGCFDVDNILVTITKLPAIVEMAGKFKCPNCSHIFQCGAKRMDQILATFGHRLIKSLHHEPKGRFESDLLVCHFVVRWSHWDSFDTLGTPALLKISII